jgi:hypothetical protein
VSVPRGRRSGSLSHWVVMTAPRVSVLALAVQAWCRLLTAHALLLAPLLAGSHPQRRPRPIATVSLCPLVELLELD